MDLTLVGLGRMGGEHGLSARAWWSLGDGSRSTTGRACCHCG